MDFFDAQDRARRKTWWLIALFALAVVALIVVTNLLVVLVFAFVDPMTGTRTFESTPLSTWLAITAIVCLTVSAASGSRWWALRSGGRGVAEAFGGRLVHRGTTDLHEQRLLNVVEEMAIASGTPVPPVYVIPEPSINAFAAGFTPDDAVIGVNQGTLEHLTREELQGVIGHEFSHILENDTGLNLRLIAILHGILFLGLAGQAILRTGGRSRRDGLPVALLGLGLVVIGYSGTFFGNLIKAGVSRSREYLADASSVRFTRNPGGLAGALKKIGGLPVGSRMTGAAVTEASHMFFGQPRKLWLNALLATHPPLDRRILALEPGWNRRFPVLEAPPFATVTPAPRSAGMVAAVVSATAAALDGEDPQVRAARTLIERAPARERFATRDPWAARALVYALLIDDDPGIRSAQMRALDLSEPGLHGAVTELGRGLEHTDAMQRMALLELAVPALKELSVNQYRDFVQQVVALVRADERISLLEWSAHRVLLKELSPHFEGPRRTPARYRDCSERPDACAELLAALANEAAGTPEEARAAFAAGASALGLDPAIELAPDPNFVRLNEALRELRRLVPLARPRLIKAASACVFSNGIASAHQQALMHGIAATLDCPLPPDFDALREAALARLDAAPAT